MAPSVSFSEEIQSVSLMHLIVTPEKYEGKKVDIIGYASFTFEAHILWFHKEDALSANVMNAVWLDVGKLKEVEKYNGKYIQVIGTYTDDKGHLGMYPGTIVIDKIKLKGSEN